MSDRQKKEARITKVEWLLMKALVSSDPTFTRRASYHLVVRPLFFVASIFFFLLTLLSDNFFNLFRDSSYYPIFISWLRSNKNLFLGEEFHEADRLFFALVLSTAITLIYFTTVLMRLIISSFRQINISNASSIYSTAAIMSLMGTGATLFVGVASIATSLVMFFFGAGQYADAYWLFGALGLGTVFHRLLTIVRARYGWFGTNVQEATEFWEYVFRSSNDTDGGFGGSAVEDYRKLLLTDLKLELGKGSGALDHG